MSCFKKMYKKICMRSFIVSFFFSSFLFTPFLFLGLKCSVTSFSKAFIIFDAITLILSSSYILYFKLRKHHFKKLQNYILLNRNDFGNALEKIVLSVLVIMLISSCFFLSIGFFKAPFMIYIPIFAFYIVHTEASSSFILEDHFISGGMIIPIKDLTTSYKKCSGGSSSLSSCSSSAFNVDDDLKKILTSA